MNDNVPVAMIQPFELEDPVLGTAIAVRVSEYYSTIHIGERVFYFIKETGEFDGTSCPMKDNA